MIEIFIIYFIDMLMSFLNEFEMFCGMSLPFDRFIARIVLGAIIRDGRILDLIGM